jgi:hypothetical protein
MRAPAPHGPHTSASLLRGREPLHTRPDTVPVTVQSRPLPLLRHHRSSPAKFPSLSHPRIAFCLMHRRPSHPLSPRVVISCIDALRRHVPAKPPVLAGAAADHHDASTQRQGPAQHLCFLLPCWHCVRFRLAIQLPSLGPRRHGVLVHARLPCGHVQRHPLASSSWIVAYGQSSLGVALTQGRCRWCPRCSLHRACVLHLCTALSCPFPPAHVLRSMMSRPSSSHVSTKGPPPPCILSTPPASLSAGTDAAASACISMTSSPSPDLTGLPLSSSACPRAPTTSKKLSEAWPTSPIIGAARHRRRAPVRSATTSLSCSDALLPAFSCRASVWDSHDAMGGAPSCHSATGRSLSVTPRWSVVRTPMDVERAESAPACALVAERALRPG